MAKTTCFGQHWPSSDISSERFVCCKSVHIKHTAAYRCCDLIIEDFEIHTAYSLGVELSDMGSEQVEGGGGRCRFVSSFFAL